MTLWLNLWLWLCNTYSRLGTWSLFWTKLRYLSGSTVRWDGFSPQKSALWHALTFMAGFTFVFVVLFGMSVSFSSGILGEFANVTVIIGGLVLIIFSPYVIFRIVLQKKLEAHLDRLLLIILTLIGYARSIFIGMVFATGWTPTIGPLLGAVLTLAIQGQRVGLTIFYLFVYSTGLAVPFLVLAWPYSWVSNRLRTLNRYIGLIEGIISAFILFIVGVMLVTGVLNFLNTLVNPLTPNWLLEYL